ncbi:polysaccharide biosynthesis protein [Paenibacillus pectinilyticus]|uniref:Polysaccharide biosynthesis protein n=1 Tax=Paenibacillus pectinilyticus TaxID=512399 RepID=A0A1C0ZSH2_9BACL|nr:oligosaccharide flippase family protein [Paenibacillus pectinilyticus]OCT11018.1 polysaccharide biosynthesis protein [Paenibacillus pectinilyticus]
MKNEWMNRVLRLKNNNLTKNTLWMFIGNGLKTGIQAIYFIFIARALGVEGFGAFVGVVAITSIFSPFASFGTGNILVRNVARDRSSFKESWGNALIITVLSGILLVGILLIVAHLFLPATIPIKLLATVAISDMIFARILDISGQAFQAFERLGWTAQLQVCQSVMRMIAACGLFFTVSQPTPDQWGGLYLLCTVLTTVMGVIIVNRQLGYPSMKLTFTKKDIVEGFYFSISLSSQGVYNEIDKSILAKISTLEATGIYAAAYRIIDVVFTPIRSLLAASYGKFFQHGSRGISGSLQFAKKLLPAGCVYGVVSGMMLYAFAPIIPYVLGSDYNNAVEAIRWMAILPCIRGLQYFAADLLTGAGLQGYRSMMQIGVAIVSVVLNMVLIPLYSWKGAIISGLVANTVLGVGLWVIVWQCKTKTKLITKVASQ